MKVEQVRQHPRVVSGGCLSSYTARQVVIYDHKKAKNQADDDQRIDGHCYIRQPREEASVFDFTVRNPGGRLFHFIAVDKCMFSDKEGISRCDCVVFNASVSMFIDLKDNKSVSGRQKGRRKAIVQICASIEWFLAENLLTDREEVEVIVANGNRKRHPRLSTSKIEKTAELQDIFPNLIIRYDELPFRKL
jgi:hypothetical protein